MADRVLTWFVPMPIEVGVTQRGAYVLDQDYVPVRVHLHAARAATVTDIVIDINNDFEGVTASIFTTPNPGIEVNSQVGERNYFVEPRIMKQNSVVTFDIDQIGSGEGGGPLTVSLELEYT